MRLRERFRRLSLWNKLGAVGSAASILGLLLTVAVCSRPVEPPAPPVTLVPDVGLSFHHVESPQFRIQNLSKGLVREAKYRFLLYDLDLPGPREPYLNLTIPVAILDDYIRPMSSLGPWGITSLSREGGHVRQGHRLFGYAHVQCPTCVSFRHYWVYFHVGESGWSSEIPKAEQPAILKNLSRVLYEADSALDAIEELIPTSARDVAR